MIKNNTNRWAKMAEAHTGAFGSHILINLSTRRLSYFEGERLAKTYPVGVGKASTPTPAGSYRVVEKIMNPGGVLGTRWMGLSIPNGNYGIHGTNNPQSIGGYVSNGCIRMYNRDVEELFPKVSIGTPVVITWGKNGPGSESLKGSPRNGLNGSKAHIVQHGETLWQIARKYGKSLNSIIELNRIANPDVIYPGQVIMIPA
ncbi:MAG TPA: L,D-transpeptidase family protein [Bacillota bacterium]|nr:L,D-transpeptidase family protein [Bacillota bacterium]